MLFVLFFLIRLSVYVNYEAKVKDQKLPFLDNFQSF